MATLDDVKKPEGNYVNPPYEEEEKSDFYPIQLDADLREYLGVYVKLRFVFKDGIWKGLLLLDGNPKERPADWDHVSFSHLFIKDPELWLRLAKWCLLTGFTLKGPMHAEEIVRECKEIFQKVLKLCPRFWDKLNEKGKTEQKSLEDL